MTIMFPVANNLWRGPRPKTYQELIDEGFEIVINLESGAYDLFHPKSVYEEQEELSAKAKLIPCSDIVPPEKWKVQRFLELVAQGKKTFVHCQAGKDRTGFMCAVYRMQVCGWTYDQAIQEMLSMGQHWYFRWWIPFLRCWKNDKLG